MTNDGIRILGAERQRLAESDERTMHWRRWGPYLSERQWGTVREDYSADGDAWGSFPHDHARSRAYRWGEDGLWESAIPIKRFVSPCRCGTARTRSSRSGSSV